MSRISSTLVFLGLTVVLGCSKGPTAGVSVTGTIIADNSPLGEGLITFIPLGETAGKKCSVLIQSGNYTIQPAQGLSPGEYRVEIMGLPPGIKDMAEGKTPSHGPTAYREVDSAYNEKTKLKCTLHASVENKVDFSVSYQH